MKNLNQVSQAKTNNSKSAAQTAKNVASAVGTVGKVAVAGAAIVGHCVLSVIGAIVCAVTKD